MEPTLYWWKTHETWNGKVFAGAILFAWALTSGALFICADRITASGPAIDSGLSFESVRGLIWVSLGWILMVSSITFGQTLTKENGPESVQNVALRSLGNTLEYGLMTLLLIWLHGLYCNAAAATLFGAIYVLARLFYPYFYGYYGEFTVYVELATQPGYFAKGFLLTGILAMLTTNTDLAATVAIASYQPLVCLGGWMVYAFVFGMILGMPLFLNFKAGAARKQKIDESRPHEE